MQDRALTFNIDSLTASWIISVMGIANFLGKIGCGQLVDMVISRFGKRNAVYFSSLTMITNGLGERRNIMK